MIIAQIRKKESFGSLYNIEILRLFLSELFLADSK